MYLDALTLSALADEFLDVIAGGRIQDVIDVDETSIGLEIYAGHQRHYLLLSADQRAPRVHLVPERLRRGLAKPTQIGLLLRRKAEGGILSHISQPQWERILQFDIEGMEGLITLVIESMERRANILILANGIILDAMRRVGADENRVRVSLPQHPYIPPPPQIGKHDPAVLDAGEIEMLLARGVEERPARQVLTGGILGVSPLVAEEILFRAGYPAKVRAGDVSAERLLAAAQSFFEPLLRRRWTPGIVEEADGGVSAFSVYPLTSRSGWRPVETPSASLSAFYGAPVGEEAYRAGKQPIFDALSEAQIKVTARLESLRRSLVDDSEREKWRKSGELILAYQYILAPGQRELRAQYDADEPEMVIPLDPTLSPLENAQRYFDRYNRAKRALDDVPALIEEAQHELDFLAQLATDLELAANWPEIDEVKQALAARGYWRGTPTARVGGGKSVPLRIVTDEGFVIWVGRNSRQNEQVTFDKGSPQDLWLHARGVPGAHVIIKTDGRHVPEAVIERAASLAAYYSASRNEAKVIVDMTYRRYVRKIKGGGLGQVTYRNEETRTVVPRSEKEL